MARRKHWIDWNWKHFVFTEFTFISNSKCWKCWTTASNYHADSNLSLSNWFNEQKIENHIIALLHVLVDGSSLSLTFSFYSFYINSWNGIISSGKFIWTCFHWFHFHRSKCCMSFVLNWVGMLVGKCSLVLIIESSPICNATKYWTFRVGTVFNGSNGMSQSSEKKKCTQG